MYPTPTARGDSGCVSSQQIPDVPKSVWSTSAVIHAYSSFVYFGIFAAAYFW